MLRTFSQAFTACDTRGCRVTALDGRHRDGVFRHRPLLVAVQDVVVVHIGKDVTDGDIVRTWNALVASRAVDVSRCVTIGINGCSLLLALGGSVFHHFLEQLPCRRSVLQLIHRLYRYCIVSRQSYSAHDGSPDKVSSAYFIIRIHTCPLLLQK